MRKGGRCGTALASQLSSEPTSWQRHSRKLYVENVDVLGGGGPSAGGLDMTETEVVLSIVCSSPSISYMLTYTCTCHSHVLTFELQPNKRAHPPVVQSCVEVLLTVSTRRNSVHAHVPSRTLSLQYGKISSRDNSTTARTTMSVRQHHTSMPIRVGLCVTRPFRTVGCFIPHADGPRSDPNPRHQSAVSDSV